jgi:hypothetical protein
MQDYENKEQGTAIARIKKIYAVNQNKQLKKRK